MPQTRALETTFVRQIIFTACLITLALVVGGCGKGAAGFFALLEQCPGRIAKLRRQRLDAACTGGGIADLGEVAFLEQQKLVPLSRYEAYSLSSMAADCRVSQVVDVRKGVHCMVPKSLFVKK